MDFKLFIGVDTAKAKYDIVQLTPRGERLCYEVVDNNNDSVNSWLDELLASHDIKPDEVLICVEQTGVYTNRMTHLAHAKGISVWLEDAYHLNRSMGSRRAKTDEIDAGDIAKYAHRNYQDFSAFKPVSKVVEQIKSLENQRRRLQKAINQLSVPVDEEVASLAQPLADECYRYTRQAIKKMEQSLAKIDAQIDQVIENDETLKKKRKYATSIPGFGKVNFRNLVCQTYGFTRLNNPRALCASIGIAPYPKQSGKCLNRKPQIPKMANSKFKADLTCAVRSIMRANNRIGEYFRRKRDQERKLYLVAVNNTRNKIIHTVMACIRKEVMYDENYT